VVRAATSSMQRKVNEGVSIVLFQCCARDSQNKSGLPGVDRLCIAEPRRDLVKRPFAVHPTRGTSRRGFCGGGRHSCGDGRFIAGADAVRNSGAVDRVAHVDDPDGTAGPGGAMFPTPVQFSMGHSASSLARRRRRREAAATAAVELVTE
jgi:hypothetical protein